MKNKKSLAVDPSKYDKLDFHERLKKFVALAKKSIRNVRFSILKDISIHLMNVHHWQTFMNLKK